MRLQIQAVFEGFQRVRAQSLGSSGSIHRRRRIRGAELAEALSDGIKGRRFGVGGVVLGRFSDEFAIVDILERDGWWRRGTLGWSGGSAAEFGEVFSDFIERLDFGGFGREVRRLDGRGVAVGGWLSGRRWRRLAQAGFNVTQVGRVGKR